MKDSAKFGMNKTGIHMSPMDTKKMEAGLTEFPMPNMDTSTSFAQLKTAYIQESGTVGSVPMPGTMKAALSAGMQKLKGEHPAMLIDKLGERLAFERSGVRLYDALIIKCSASIPGMPLEILNQFREEEAQHFFLLKDVIESLGADPTAQTPCADTSAVASMGLMQVLNDPRTTVPQCVEAILIAELADNDGWGLLLQLAHEAGLSEAVEKFKVAQLQEDKHLAFIRNWLAEMTLANKSVH